MTVLVPLCVQPQALQLLQRQPRRGHPTRTQQRQPSQQCCQRLNCEAMDVVWAATAPTADAAGGPR